MAVTTEQMARAIDHTLLKPEATPEQIHALCVEAIEHGFGAVCVLPVYVERAARVIEQRAMDARGGHSPCVVSVAGFPLGASLTATKADEARRAIEHGATEIDMVIHLGSLIAGDDQAVQHDIQIVADTAHQALPNGVLKVILETAALTTEQVIRGCRASVESGADFVKTSTGCHASGGATVEHVRLLGAHASPLSVKASGGIRTAEAAVAMLNAGATRIGTSSGIAILAEMRRRWEHASSI